MKWRELLLSLKIRQKIFYPAMFVAFSLIALFSATFLYVSRNIFEREARNNIRTLANTMGMLVSIQSRALEQATAEQEKKLMLSLLEPGKMKKEFVYLAIFNLRGRLMASVGEQSENQLEQENHARIERVLARRMTFVERSNGSLVFVTPLYILGVLKAILVGTVSTATLDDEMRRVTLFTITVSILILIGAGYVLRRLAHSIAEPVALLRDAADDLRERRFETGLQKLQKRRWGRDELGFLRDSFSDMGENLRNVLLRLEDKIALVNADLRQAHEELQKSHLSLQEKQRLLERELALARDIQEKLLPPLPALPGLELAAKMVTATSVGGDFYCLRRDREKNLSVIIGDVSGHGVPSALIMVLMREAFLRYSIAGLTPREVLTRMNRAARADFSPGMFASCFLVRFEEQNRRLRFANAGHNYPLLIKKDRVLELDTTGFAMGISEEGNYGEGVVDLEAGDILFLYTDGIAELRGKADDQFLGTEGICAMLQQNRGLPVKSLEREVENIMRSHAGAPPWDDDATFFIVKIA